MGPTIFMTRETVSLVSTLCLEFCFVFTRRLGTITQWSPENQGGYESKYANLPRWPAEAVLGDLIDRFCRLELIPWRVREDWDLLFSLGSKDASSDPASEAQEAKEIYKEHGWPGDF